ncbi:MAG: hypothetical protein ACLQVX_05295 [Limisphaerales bacterium]
MNRFLIAMAEVTPEDLPAGKGWAAGAHLDILVVVGALGLIVLLVLIWAVAIRKPHRRHHHHDHRDHHHHHHHRDHQESDPSTVNPVAGFDEQEGDGETPGEPRRRHRHRDHRPRNPTLAETGGLPPIRGGKPPGEPLA